MDSGTARKILDDCLRRHDALAGQLKDVGFLWQGSVSKRYLTCGKSGCPCHTDPAQRHGPYLYWSSKVAGRSVSKALSGPQAQVVQQWVANRVRFDSIVEQMKQVAKEAFEAAAVLQQEQEREAGL
jgi:hypothetical protein